MKQRSIAPWLIIILILLAGGILWYVSSRSNQAAPQATNQVTYVEDQTITLQGHIACLPHKDKTAPQTTECALGLNANGTYYSLKDVSPEASSAYSSDQAVEVIGKFNAATTSEKYDIAGTITVETITPLGGQQQNQNPNLQTYTNSEFGFSLMYDPMFAPLSEEENARLAWSYPSDLPGRRLVTLQLPKTFQPKTNFSEAMISVGVADSATAVSACLTPAKGSNVTKQTINGTDFTVLSSSDAGAGNLYTTKSYRVLKNKSCFALEETIHSTNIDNYPKDQGISEFDKAKVETILQKVITSFTFSK